ncbi:polysaccharide deacetylase family protein [Pseudoalteromonas xiamenensis]
MFSKYPRLPLLLLSASFACAQVSANNAVETVPAKNITYPNKARNAISITFDDARATQLTEGVPLLNQYQVKGTFYLIPKAVSEHIAGWKAAAKAGHEIGNHSSSHLCTGNFQWLRSQNAGLEQVNLAWMEKDILDANTYLETNLGVKIRSFAYPCGQTFVGRGEAVKSYVPIVAKYFDTGRRWLDETGNNPGYVDFVQLTSLVIDGKTFEQVKQMIEQLRANNAWIILTGHDVGSSAQYTTDKQMLTQLFGYLQAPENGFWLGTVSEVADHIRAQRTAPKTEMK